MSPTSRPTPPEIVLGSLQPRDRPKAVDDRSLHSSAPISVPPLVASGNWRQADFGHLSEVMNAQVVSLDDAVKAYQAFDHGSPKEYIIDPHSTTKKAQPVAGV